MADESPEMFKEKPEGRPVTIMVRDYRRDFPLDHVGGVDIASFRPITIIVHEAEELDTYSEVLEQIEVPEAVTLKIGERLVKFMEGDDGEFTVWRRYRLRGAYND